MNVSKTSNKQTSLFGTNVIYTSMVTDTNKKCHKGVGKNVIKREKYIISTITLA